MLDDRVDVAEAKAPENVGKADSEQGQVELLANASVRIELAQRDKRAIAGDRVSQEARRHLAGGHFKIREAAHPITLAPEKAFHNGDS